MAVVKRARHRDGPATAGHALVGLTGHGIARFDTVAHQA